MICGKKITLRALENKDAETLRLWRNHPELSGFHFSTLPVSEIAQQRWYENATSSSTSAVFMIDNENQVPIGYTLLKDIDYKNRTVEIGLHLDPAHHGQGYGKDAFKTLMGYCFSELNMHRLSLQVFAFNERALKMYENMGFKTEGRLRDAFFTKNKYHDIVVMSMLSTEFKPE